MRRTVGARRQAYQIHSILLSAPSIGLISCAFSGTRILSRLLDFHTICRPLADTPPFSHSIGCVFLWLWRMKLNHFGACVCFPFSSDWPQTDWWWWCFMVMQVAWLKCWTEILYVICEKLGSLFVLTRLYLVILRPQIVPRIVSVHPFHVVSHWAFCHA